MEPITAASPDLALTTITSKQSRSRSHDAEHLRTTKTPSHHSVEEQPTAGAPPSGPELHDAIHPDGGLRAWLVVLGSFCFLFPTYGWMQSIGTVQTYLETHQLSAYTNRDVGWIPSVFTALALLLGIWIGPLFDRRGPTALGIVGAALYAAHFFLLAECTTYWQFMLCLGLLGGIGAAIVSNVAMSVISNWFLRRRGLAMGIVLSGSSVGGTVVSIQLQSIFERLGWTWSIRIVGFIELALLIVGNLCIRPNPRLAAVSRAAPDPARDKKEKTKVIDFSAFRSGPFTLITVSLFAMEFVIFGATGLLPTYAAIAGFPPSASFYVISILNAASCFGRTLPGLAGDYFGPFNVLIVMLVFTLLSMLVVWLPFGGTYLVAFYVFAALWGFGTGSFLSLTPVCAGKTCDTKNFGRYFGTMYFVVSFSLFITIPLGGQMLQSVGTKALPAFTSPSWDWAGSASCGRGGLFWVAAGLFVSRFKGEVILSS
ncbi:Uu.00g041900.m01.CDS01 [Anthostomella pinea]|uniref:Uu.00g041900.m01.CDS01 n=1 Tax=Anthostomella pinea TaxID=933095 RepID=A0AAI8VAZ9_9PEZI|nr:Uu.00g041900.m01.CDS01 [Anthostomella pinea]